MVMVVNDQRGLLVVSLGDGFHHRLALIDPASASPAAVLSRCRSLTLAIRCGSHRGVDFRPREPFSLSRFTDETRLAERSRKGRMLLVRRSRPISTSPMGGRAMTCRLPGRD